MDLKPCPFCGGSAEIVEAVEAGPNAYVVTCLGCQASSMVAFPIKDDVRAMLIGAWNRRAATSDASARAILESCSEWVEWSTYERDPEPSGTVCMDGWFTLEQVEAIATLMRAANGDDDDDPIVNAQHEETGRVWQGKRSQIPPRFHECSAEGANDVG